MKKPLLILLYLSVIHFTGILFFTIFRLVFYVVNMEMAGVDNGLLFLGKALLHGLQFDNFMAAYVSCVPLLVLSIFALCNKIPKTVITICTVFCVILYALFFIISIADIPYFAYFFTHIGIAAFGWFEFGGETAGLLLREKTHYPYLAFMIISIVFFAWLVRGYGKKLLKAKAGNLQKRDYKFYIPLILLSWSLCFAGMRGSFQLYPLRVDYAYFSNNSFFNQLGVNPSFFLLKSISLKQINHVNDQMAVDEAIVLAQRELNATPLHNDSPLKRDVTPAENETPLHANVIIVWLESMAAKYLEYETLTPYLHDLISKSYYFDHFYSSGIHTNNGIVSTLYGFPALFDKPSMSSVPALYDGLPHHLKENGYQTLFFMGGNPGYDHMSTFLYENSFDRIFSQNDYPGEKIANNFGVQDDYLLQFCLERLNETAETHTSFLANILTVSNHGPYIVPEKYKDRADTEDKQIICFVDDALKEFMENAAKQAWYENTIFAFLGDHGKVLGESEYNMPLDLNHIPLILYSPMFADAPRRFPQFGGQVDVFPTVMGLLNLPYANNSLGIDLLKESRPCIYFVNDNQLGCIDNDFLYVRNLPAKKDILYDLHGKTAENILEQQPQACKKLKEYAVSMTITADYLIRNKLTGRK